MPPVTSPRSSPRPRCPFYGFHWPPQGSNLHETGTAECGLDLTAHGPCTMETEQKSVDFDICAVRSKCRNLLDAGRHHIRFFGPELPAGGLRLDRWHDLVMRQEELIRKTQGTS